jgi:hypothetical protein
MGREPFAFLFGTKDVFRTRVARTTGIPPQFPAVVGIAFNHQPILRHPNDLVNGAIVGDNVGPVS